MKNSTKNLINKPLSDYIYKIFLYGAKILNAFTSKSKDIMFSSILCYHSISNDGWRYSTTISDFEAQIDYLLTNKKIVSLDEIYKNNSNQVALTFDDGYKDFIKNALPLLKKRNVKGTLFVLGTPDKANRKALSNNKELLTIDEIKQIKKLGWEIGFHTNTHTSLPSLSTNELRKEIIEGKKNLEKKLGFKLRFFAYPMGEYTQKVVQIVKEAGFEAAFSTKGGPVSIKNTSDMHIIDRVCLEGDITLDQFQTLITHLGLLFNKSFINLIRVKAALSKSL